MPRDVTVTFGDGSSAVYKGVPDAATPDEVLQRLGTDYPGREVKSLDGGQPAPVLKQVADFAQDSGVKAGADLIAGFGKGVSSMPAALPQLTPPNSLLRRMQPALDSLTKQNTDFYERFGKKEGSAPGFSKTIAESVGGAAAFGGVTPGAVTSAVGSGAGSEAAAQALGDNFLTRLAGGLAGGFGGAMGARVVSSRAPNAEALAREAMQGISPRQLEEASMFQQAQAAKGIQVDLAQSLEAVGAPASNVTTIRNFLANKTQGTRVQESLRNQPGQLSQEADLTAARLPGTNYGFNQGANNLQEAATNAVNAVKRERSRQVKDMYGAAGVMTPTQLKEIEDEVGKFLVQPGITEKVGAAGRDFIRKLRGEDAELTAAADKAREAVGQAKDTTTRMAAQSQLEAANQALAAKRKTVSALDVDTWIGEMTGPFKGTPLNPIDPKTAGQMKGLGKSVNTKFQSLSPEVKAAEAKFAELSESLVNPVKQSLTGQIATPRGYKPDVQATMGRFTEALGRGTDATAKVSDIATLGTQLAKVDKEAFGDALKTHVSAKIKSAMEPGATSATAANNPDMAQRIAGALWGNELQAQGLRDAVAIAARSQGQNPTDAVRGLNNLMQLTKAMKSRPQSVGGMQPEDLFRIGGRNMGADALRVFGFLPFERTARKVEDAVMGKTLQRFDEILTSPEGAKLLTELGRESVMSRRIPVLLANFGAQVGTGNMAPINSR